MFVELLVFDKSLLSWDNLESAGKKAKEAKLPVRNLKRLRVKKQKKQNDP